MLGGGGGSNKYTVYTQLQTINTKSSRYPIRATDDLHREIHILLIRIGVIPRIVAWRFNEAIPIPARSRKSKESSNGDTLCGCHDFYFFTTTFFSWMISCGGEGIEGRGCNIQIRYFIPLTVFHPVFQCR
jgi:hypothetical protein